MSAGRRAWTWRALSALAALAGSGAGALAACSQATVPLPAFYTGEGDATMSGLDAEAGPDAVASDADAGEASDGHAPADGATDGSVHDAQPTCSAAGDAGACGFGPQCEPADLKCTGLYSDWASKTVAAGVVAYTPGLPFWSDGAVKTRWIALPAAATIDTSNMDEWTFPVGTKIWKEFRLPLAGADAASPVRIETRLLWKQGPGNWVRTTYRWTSDGETDATELLQGELDANGEGYEVPSQIACNECHQGRIDGVLGIEAVSLSAPGASGITMDSLVEAGLVTNAPAGPLVVPGDAVAAAALGWLHMNCGTACHNSGGIASGSGFFMRLDVATLASVQSTRTFTTGWNQPTNGFQIPDASTTYRIHACDVPSSAAYYRASLRTGVSGAPPFVQMPPIDSHQTDVADLAGLAAWINECDGG